jgi:hypothetical protein
MSGTTWGNEHRRKESHQGASREVKRGRRAICAVGDQMLVHEVASRMWGKRTEALEGRCQSNSRKEFERGTGREDIRKQRGKNKAQNMGGRRDYRAWRKLKKIKRKDSHREKVKISECRTRRLGGGDTRGRNLGNSRAALGQMVREQRTWKRR